MAIAWLVFQKLVSFFLLMLVGLYLMKKEIFNQTVTLQLSKLLTMLVAPSLFVASFMSASFSVEKLYFLGVTILAAFVILAVRILFLSWIPSFEAIDTYAILFANVGFMGTPLALAIGGTETVFYISGFVLVNQLAQWTYGVYLITKDRRRIQLRQLFVNPASIATAIGLLLFCLPFDLPQPVSDAIHSFAQLNTPLSTVVLGTYFYQVAFSDIFGQLKAYWTAFFRLIVTSLLSLLLIWLLPIEHQEVKLALTIASCAPSALNTALLSQVFGGDYAYGSRLVLLTTSLSLLTIPLMILLASFLYL